MKWTGRSILATGITLSIALAFALRLVTDGVLAVVGLSPIWIYLGMIGIYITLIPTTFVALGIGHIHVPSAFSRDVRSMTFVTVLSLAYFALWLPLGLMAGQHPMDVVGSTARALLPFLMIGSAIVAFSTLSLDVRARHYRRIGILLLGFIAAAAVGKLLLISAGYFYGAGLNQFSIGAFGLVWFLLLLTKGNLGVWSKFALGVALIVLLILTALSLKRAIWAELAVGIGIALLAMKSSRRLFAVGIMTVTGIVGVMGMAYFGSLGRLEDRFRYTFTGVGEGLESLDNSTYTRIAEVQAATYTLNKYPPAWITGYGPGAGYDNPHGFTFSNFNEAGKPYHIHSSLMLVVYRYGIIGLVMHAALVLLSLKWLFALGRIVRAEARLDPLDPALLGFTCAAAMLAMMPRSLTSNVLFGDPVAGVLIATALFCRIDATHRIPQKLSSRFSRLRVTGGRAYAEPTARRFRSQ